MPNECIKMVELRGTYQKWIWIKIIVLSLLSSISWGQTPTLILSPNVVEIGQNFTVTCQVEINNEIHFLVNNTKKGECPLPGLGDPCTPPNIEQNFPARVTTWTLTAAEEYDGSWTCRRFGGFEAPSVSITMYKCPDSVISETGIDSHLSLNKSATVRITVIIGCIYPAINPDFKLRFLSPQSSTEKGLNCKTTSSSCITGSAYECIHTISSESDLEKETNYTLHIESVVLQSVGSCPRLAIFEPYSVLFDKIGHDSTTQQPVTTEQSPVGVSTSYSYLLYSSTKHSGKENTETELIISTDTYITTSNASTVPKGQSLLVHVMIPVSVGSFCVVVIVGLTICCVSYKRHANRKRASEIYTDPDTTSHKEHVYQGRSATNPEHGQYTNAEESSLHSSLNHNELSHKLSHDEYRYTRRNPQNVRYEKNFNNDSRVDRRLHPIEMPYLPHGYYRNEHYAFGPQANSSAVLKKYYYDHQRRKMMHQRDHNSFSNFSFYRG